MLFPKYAKHNGVLTCNLGNAFWLVRSPGLSDVSLFVSAKVLRFSCTSWPGWCPGQAGQRLLFASGFCGCTKGFYAHFGSPKESPKDSPKSPGFLWIFRQIGVSGLVQNSRPRPPQVVSPDLQYDCP